MSAANIPVQVRSVDPYASYNSDIVNLHTRILSGGVNCLLYPNPIDVTLDGATFKTTFGRAIMQDVFIECNELIIDILDPSFYYNWNGTNFELGYYAVVLVYEYWKTSPPPEAQVKILFPSQLTTLAGQDGYTMLFLKWLYVDEITGDLSVTDTHPIWPQVVRWIVGAPGTGGSSSSGVTSVVNLTGDVTLQNLLDGGVATWVDQRMLGGPGQFIAEWLPTPANNIWYKNTYGNPIFVFCAAAPLLTGMKAILNFYTGFGSDPINDPSFWSGGISEDWFTTTGDENIVSVYGIVGIDGWWKYVASGCLVQHVQFFGNHS